MTDLDLCYLPAGEALRLFKAKKLSPVELMEATIRRAELTEIETSMTTANDSAVRRALEAAGVEFIDENGGGPGVRLRKSVKEKPQK